MKSFNVLVAALAALTLAFNAPVEKVTVNTEASVVVWKGYKVTGSHEGTIKLQSGELQMEGGQLVGGSFVMDMASITDTDMEGPSAKKLEGHLKSPDFFGVEKYPTASFNITSVVSRGTAGSYKVTGDIKIKESTKSIRFNVQLGEENGQQVATAEVQLDRSDFDVRYGSGSFFDGLGDRTIYDEFDLVIRLVLN